MTRWHARPTVMTVALIATAALLQGCVYDPYAVPYQSCCVYPGYAYGGYPANWGYGGAVIVGGSYNGGHAEPDQRWHHDSGQVQRSAYPEHRTSAPATGHAADQHRNGHRDDDHHG